MASSQAAPVAAATWPPSPPRSPTRSTSSSEPDSLDPVTATKTITTTETSPTVPPELAAKAQQGQTIHFPASPQISPLLSAITVPAGSSQQQIQQELLQQLQHQAAQLEQQILIQQQQTNIPTIITPPQPAALVPPPSRHSISSITSSSSSSTSSSSCTNPSSTSSGAVSPGGHRMSLQTTMVKMPPIHEDADSIFTDVGPASRRRSTRGTGFYQYGEDYITTYEDLGGLPSPLPPPQQRPSSMLSVRSARSVSSGSGSEGAGAGASGGGGGGYFLSPLAAAAAAAAATSSSSSSGRRASGRLSSVGGVSASGMSRASRHVSTASSFMGPVSEEEKAQSLMALDPASTRDAATTASTSSAPAGVAPSLAAATDRSMSSDLGERGLKEGMLEDGDGAQSRGWFRRWRRTIVLLLVVLLVAGFAVGLAFGLKQ